MGKKLPSVKEAFQWEGSTLFKHWDGHFTVRRKLSVERKLFPGKKAFHWKQLLNEKGTSNREDIHSGDGVS